MNAMMVARAVVLTGLGFAAMVAGTHWAVRQKHLAPFGAWPRLVRRMSDPVLLPVERRLVKAGKNPQDAPLWLLGIVVVAGLILLSSMGWLAGAWFGLKPMIQAGPRGWLLILINFSYRVLMVALFTRIIGSWLGWDRYRRWMRPAYWLTDWIISPIRRFLPPWGMIDFSPFVAWILLMALRSFIVGFIV